MRLLLAGLVIIAFANVAKGLLKPGLRVKFFMDSNPSAGESYFYKVPYTIPDAIKEGWKVTRRPPGPLPQLEMYCTPDRAVCPLFDDTGYIAGLQVAFPINDISYNELDWEKRGFGKWKTLVNGKWTTMWSQLQLYISAESLKKSKEERLAARDPTRILQEKAVWVTGTNGEVLKVPTSEKEIINEGVFTKQGCMPWMGQHWYYNMSSTTPCDEENLYSWFPMTTDEEIKAIGFVTIGTLPIPKTRNWFESPPLEIVERIVNHGPQCLYDLVKDPGATTLHVYFTDEPWKITCPTDTS